jgi:hypothetical protein
MDQISLRILMKNPVSKLLAVASVALLSIGTISAPAGATSVGDGLSMQVTVSDTGSGADRLITWTVTVTDSQGRTFVSGTPVAGQIRFGTSSARACETTPVSFELTTTNSGKCSSYFNSGSVTPTLSGSTMTVTYNSRDHVGGNFSTGLTGYLEALASSNPVAANVAYLTFGGQSGEYSLYSTTTISAGGAAATPENDPGVSFAGFLVSSASGRNFTAETPGTLRFTGKRLHQVRSATIGGIAVSITGGTSTALVIDFDALPKGKHDVVLTEKSGAKTTLRGFVTVN